MKIVLKYVICVESESIRIRSVNCCIDRSNVVLHFLMPASSIGSSIDGILFIDEIDISEENVEQVDVFLDPR